MKVRVIDFAAVGWSLLGLGAVIIASGYSLDSRALWIAGCVAGAVGVFALAVGRWRGETVLASGARDNFEPTAYYAPGEVPHAEAVSALGDRGEEPRPR